MHYLKLCFLIIGSVFVVSCSSLQTPTTHIIKPKQDVWVTNVRGESVQIGKDSEYVVENMEPVLVEAPGKVGVYVLPPSKESQEVTVKLRRVTSWGGPQLDSVTDQFLTTVLNDLYGVQVLLGRGKSAEALSKIRELRQEYPNISYLKLVEASCLKANGQRSEALALIEDVLSKNPGQIQATKLKEQFGGTDTPRQPGSAE